MALALSPRRTDILQRIFVPLQLVLYIGLFIASDKLVSWLHLPLPANVVGMVLLLLFFISAVVNYSDLLRTEGWRICVVIAVSTLLVLAATSLVVDRLYRFELARAARKQAHHG